MKYKGILFDMDGTVLSTLEDLTSAVNAALVHFSMPERSMEEVRRFIGNGAHRLMELAAAADCEPARFERLLVWYKDYYDAHCRIKTAPYPGIPELMAALKAAGAVLAVVSNKPHEATCALAEEFFPGLLSCAVGESAAVRRKPAPDTVETAIERLGLTREDCVYVGDSEVDVLTAANVGMDCISVSWGYRSVEELEAAGAKCIVADARELMAALA